MIINIVVMLYQKAMTYLIGHYGHIKVPITEYAYMLISPNILPCVVIVDSFLISATLMYSYKQYIIYIDDVLFTIILI